MLAKLMLRNCLRSRARSLFTILTVAAALLINALFASYQARTHGWSTYQPAQKHMAVVALTGAALELPASPSVGRTERFALGDAFLGTEQVKVLQYTEPSLLVRPYLTEGSYPNAAGCIIPTRLAERLSLSVGAQARLYVPGSSSPVVLPVTGLSSDILWPYLVVNSEAKALALEKASQEYLLVEFPASSQPAQALANLRKIASGAAVIPLEDLPASLGLVTKQSLTIAEALQSRLASLILVVAALGIANSLALSLIECSNQIGLLEAIGVPRARTSLLFIAEATLLSATGGGIALAAAYALSRARPALVGSDLAAYVGRALPVTLGLGLVGCLVLLFMWRYETPLTMLRKRAT
jgi:cell division protein FtsX